MEALLAALQAAVGAVAFLTGFASLRLHSQRDRALQRADAIYRELTAPTSAARVEDQNVELTSTALTDALHLDPVGVWTLWTSGGISVVSAGLVGVVGWRLHWHFSPNPAGWDPSFPSLIAMVAFSTVIALLGLADYKWVQGDLRRRDRKSYMEQVRSAIALRREGKPALALSTAEQLSADLHQWAWLYAFRSNCLEQLGRIHEAIPLARTACDLAPENGWWRLQLARLYWESGQGRDASEAINAALEKLPKESSALTLRGILREENGDLEGALEDLDAALRVNPDDVRALRARSRTLVRQGSDDLSTRALVRMIGESDTELILAALGARARTLVKRQEFQKAKEDLDKVLSAHPEDAEALALRALVFAGLRQTQEAKADIQTFTSLNPPFDTTNSTNIGLAYFQMDEPQRAIEELGLVLAQDGTSYRARHVRAMAYEETDQLTDAVEDYRVLLEQRPRNVHILLHRASVMAQIGLYEEALLDADEAVRLQPDRMETHGQRGTILALQRRYADAYESFAKAADLEPREVRPKVDNALALLELGRPKEALTNAETALRLDEHNVRTLIVLGAIYLQLERLQEALDALSSAISLQPDSFWAVANRGVVNDRLGRYDDALADFDRALQLKPGDTRCLTQRGCINFRMGHRLEAIKSYNDALRETPGNPGALFHRAEWFQAEDRPEDALRDFNSVLDSDDEELVADAHAHIASILSHLGRLDEAALHTQAVMDAVPRYPDIAIGVAFQFNNGGLVNESLRIFQSLSEMDSSNLVARLCKAIALCQLDRVEEGAREFRHLIVEHPSAIRGTWDRVVRPDLLYRYDAVHEVWTRVLAEVQAG